jgi:hypothetical protein
MLTAVNTPNGPYMSLYSPIPESLLTTEPARKFYSAVFNWTFTEIPDTPKEETIMFSFPATSVKYHGGSVTRADESQRKRGVKATKMYLYMNDLKGTMEVCFSLIPFMPRKGQFD